LLFACNLLNLASTALDATVCHALLPNCLTTAASLSGLSSAAPWLMTLLHTLPFSTLHAYSRRHAFCLFDQPLQLPTDQYMPFLVNTPFYVDTAFLVDEPFLINTPFVVSTDGYNYQPSATLLFLSTRLLSFRQTATRLFSSTLPFLVNTPFLVDTPFLISTDRYMPFLVDMPFVFLTDHYNYRPTVTCRFSSTCLFSLTHLFSSTRLLLF
jgi:hypothetical protein